MSLESEPVSRQRWRVLDDPVALRALAHPLRHQLMDAIARLGQATTAQAAREVRISHGLASHHLQQLAKYGFVEHATGKDHRERPWRLVATSYKWDAATSEGVAATSALERMMAEQTLDRFITWQDEREQWPAPWRDNLGMHRSGVYLTQAELDGLRKDIDALLVRYINERPIDDVASRPAGSIGIGFTLFTLPASDQTPPEQ